MFVKILKSFPWYRAAYKAGTVVEIDDKVGAQWCSAGLSEKSSKADFDKGAVAAPKKKVAQAPAAKPVPAAAATTPAAAPKAAVVTAMDQPQPGPGGPKAPAAAKPKAATASDK